MTYRVFLVATFAILSLLSRLVMAGELASPAEASSSSADDLGVWKGASLYLSSPEALPPASATKNQNLVALDKRPGSHSQNRVKETLGHSKQVHPTGAGTASELAVESLPSSHGDLGPATVSALDQRKPAP